MDRRSPGEALAWWHGARAPEPYILPGLGVRLAPFGGHECYTTQPIPANTIIAVSVGIVYPGPWLPRTGSTEPSPFAYHIENGYYLHPMTLTPDWYINHSCEPNAGSGEAFTTRAIRDIAAGESITTDYELEEADGRRPFTCRCGSPACRGRIRW